MTAEESNQKHIEITCDGPYKVEGGIPLVHKTQIVSEYGEPLTWEKDKVIPSEGTYYLCRCGGSKKKPFCDGSHHENDFDGSESAETNTNAERRYTVPGGTGIEVHRDHAVCMLSGFCGNRHTDVEGMVPGTADTEVRSNVIAMVERCPSGSFTYKMRPDGQDIEPDLPVEIAVTTEMTSNGPIMGPLWVTGGIPVERSDGKPLETRNRVTLCRCGKSENKPLCDGAHRMLEIKE